MQRAEESVVTDTADETDRSVLVPVGDVRMAVFNAASEMCKPPCTREERHAIRTLASRLEQRLRRMEDLEVTSPRGLAVEFAVRAVELMDAGLTERAVAAATVSAAWSAIAQSKGKQ